MKNWIVQRWNKKPAWILRRWQPTCLEKQRDLHWKHDSFWISLTPLQIYLPWSLQQEQPHAPRRTPPPGTWIKILHPPCTPYQQNQPHHQKGERKCEKDGFLKENPPEEREGLHYIPQLYIKNNKWIQKVRANNKIETELNNFESVMNQTWKNYQKRCLFPTSQ